MKKSLLVWGSNWVFVSKKDVTIKKNELAHLIPLLCTHKAALTGSMATNHNVNLAALSCICYWHTARSRYHSILRRFPIVRSRQFTLTLTLTRTLTLTQLCWSQPMQSPIACLFHFPKPSSTWDTISTQRKVSWMSLLQLQSIRQRLT